LKIEPLGDLRRHEDIEEWSVSDPIPVPYLGNQKVKFIVEGIEDDNSPEDFSISIKQFLSLSESDQLGAAPYLFHEYRRAANVLDEEDLLVHVGAVSEVWRHVQMTAIYVSRRHRADNLVYVQVTGNCGWDPEHGIQVVFRRGNVLARVSSQDGHLTTADAYALPEDQNTIVYGT